MGSFQKVASWLGLIEDDDGWYVDELPFEREAAELAESEHNTRIATIYAVTFQDARTVGSFFRQDVPVILNLSGVDEAEAKRFVDFASGLIMGRRGSLERVSRRVFLLLPPNVAALSADEPDVVNDGFYNQG